LYARFVFGVLSEFFNLGACPITTDNSPALGKRFRHNDLLCNYQDSIAHFIWTACASADPVRCFAHDFDANERAMLSRLARFAAATYAELEAVLRRRRIATLKQKFKAPRVPTTIGPGQKSSRMSALGH
jgi:hypothetical protein